MSNVINSAIRGGVSRLATRIAPEGNRPGPPTSFDVFFTWFAVSTLAYVCFVRLPAKLAPQYSLMTRAATSFNDFAWAAHGLHMCSTLWFAYDVLLRCVCVVFLPLQTLSKLQLLPPMPSPSSSTPPRSSPQQPLILPDSVMSLLDGLRVAFTTGDSVFSVAQTVSYLGETGTPPQHHSESYGPAQFHAVVVGTSLLCAVAIVAITWLVHTRRFRRKELIEQNLTMTDPHSGEPMPLPRQYAVRVTAVPTTTWMLVWTLGVLTCFAWHRALPALSSIVFPAATCFLLALDVLMP